MGEMQNGSARSFVYASAFHSDKAIFDNVHPTDAMLAAELVQHLHHLKRRHFGGRPPARSLRRGASSCDAGLAGARPSRCHERAITRFKMKLDVFRFIR